MNIDEKYIRRCFDLAEQSMLENDYCFGALITFNDAIIIEALNTGRSDITGHAEVHALKELIKEYPDIPPSECTLYSNFEPCAMCSFLIRDIGIGKVVFSARSPYWGGFSCWNILTTTNLQDKFTSGHRSNPPKVTPFVLEEEMAQKLDRLNWKMHRCADKENE